MPEDANAAAIRSGPGHRDVRAGHELAKHLGQVLVAAPRAAHDVELRLGRLHREVQRVGGLERGDDALQARHAAEGLERLLVGHGQVAGAAGVAQPGVLGPGARVVQAGGDRVGLEDLALVVLQDRRQRPVQHARGGRPR